MATILRDYQVQAATALHNGYAKRLHRLGIQLPTGCGKCHPHSTLIQTPHGLMKFGDLKIGDYVFGSDGKPTEVVGIYEQGVVPVYRITFSDHSSVPAGAEHLWKVWHRKRASRIMSTAQLMDTDLRDWADNGSWRWRIPMTRPVQRLSIDLPVPPYTLGALIANGCLHTGGQPFVTTPDHEVMVAIKAEHMIVQDINKSHGCPAFYVLGIKNAIKSLELNLPSGRKFIPRMYLEASVEQRVALLQGLMDADGASRSGGRRSVIYHTTSARLAYDVVELIQSLGGTANTNFQNRGVPQNRSGDTIEWTVHILMPSEINPFGTSRKQGQSQPARVFEPHRSIVSIEREGKENSRCIQVAAPNSLYLIGRDYIVTHNTVVMADISSKVLSSARTSSVNIYLHRDTLVDQTIKKLLEAGIDSDDIGVVKAKRNEMHKRCRVISIHSLRNPERMKLLPKPQLNIVDEAHVSVSPTYQRLYEYLGNSAYLAGFTATWMRSDRLGLGDVWEEVVFRRSISWAVERGYLVRPYPLQLGGDLDMSKVRTTADGDYNDNDMGEVVMVEDLLETVLQAYHQITPGLSIALFAPTQASVRFFLNGFRNPPPHLGLPPIPVAEIFDSTKSRDRKWAFHGFENGAVKILGSCSALAEGWDAPRCDGVYSLRRTKFAGRFIQEMGRALRPWKNEKTGIKKERAWIMDFVGTLDEKDMAAAVDLSKTPEKNEDIPLELLECDECGEFRVLRYVKRIDQNLCTDCFNKLDLDPEEREHTGKRIDGIIQVDLFERTSARWLKTDFGMPFISTSEKSKEGRARIYFIAYINGRYNVGVTGSVKDFAGGYWITEGVSLAEAMTVGSDAALDDDPTITHKKAAWRQSGRLATTTQIRYAQTLKIDVSDMTMADASDAITMKLASRTLGSVYRDLYQNIEVPA
jgi:superfamily II DNA or RNA helicase